MALNLKKMFKYPDDDDNLMGTEDEYYNIGEEQALKEADKTGQRDREEATQCLDMW